MPAAQAAIAIPGLILLVDGVLIPTSLGLAEHGVPQPNTIGYATGAAMLVIAGPLLNRYFGRLMLTNSAVHVPRAGARSVAAVSSPAIPALTPLIMQGARMTAALREHG